jgi:hypothetical protein
MLHAIFTDSTKVLFASSGNVFVSPKNRSVACFSSSPTKRMFSNGAGIAMIAAVVFAMLPPF